MDLVSGHIILIQVISAFLLCLHFFWRIIARKSKAAPLPEPNGALPFVGHLHLLNGQVPVCKQLGAMADKCGPIFSLKLGLRQLLVISGWEIAKECLTTHDRIVATRAKIAAGKYMGYNDAVLPLAPYGDYWRHIRKMVTVHLFSSQPVRTKWHVIESEIDSFVRELGALCSAGKTKVELSELLEFMTFNINLKLAVGKRFTSEAYEDRDGEAWRYKRAIKGAVYLSGVFVMADAFPWLGWMDLQGHVRNMKETATELDGIISNWLEEHLIKRKTESNRKLTQSDFMDVMLSAMPEDVVLGGHTRDTILKATALVLTLNGAESKSVTLTWVLSLLVNHPKVLKMAQEEIDTQVGKHKWVEESDIDGLKFLQAIVKETLRLYPPGPVTGIREASEDCRIGGYDVAKGTRLIINIWKLHRDPHVWTNPDEFIPERFLREQADFDVTGQNFEYLPFSSGRRGCPAISFAMQLVHLTLARLIQGFDIRKVGEMEVDMEEGLGLALPKKKPLQVMMAPRLPSTFYK